MSEGVPNQGVPNQGVPDQDMPEWGVPDWGTDWAADTAHVDAGPSAGQPGAPSPEAVAAQIRRRRRALVLGAVAVVLAYVAFVAVLSLIWRAWPTSYAWVLLAVVLVLAVGSLWPLRTPSGRAAWDDRAGRLIRIDAALRDHVSIGEDERDDVTAAARHRRQLAGPAWFGYPLLVLFVAFLLFNSDAISAPVAGIGTLAAVVLCALGLLRSHHRDVEAKRWLAEPLPPLPEPSPDAPESG